MLTVFAGPFKESQPLPENGIVTVDGWLWRCCTGAEAGLPNYAELPLSSLCCKGAVSRMPGWAHLSFCQPEEGTRCKSYKAELHSLDACQVIARTIGPQPDPQLNAEVSGMRNAV